VEVVKTKFIEWVKVLLNAKLVIILVVGLGSTNVMQYFQVQHAHKIATEYKEKLDKVKVVKAIIKPVKAIIKPVKTIIKAIKPVKPAIRPVIKPQETCQKLIDQHLSKYH